VHQVGNQYIVNSCCTVRKTLNFVSGCSVTDVRLLNIPRGTVEDHNGLWFCPTFASHHRRTVYDLSSPAFHYKMILEICVRY